MYGMKMNLRFWCILLITLFGYFLTGADAAQAQCETAVRTTSISASSIDADCGNGTIFYVHCEEAYDGLMIVSRIVCGIENKLTLVATHIYCAISEGMERPLAAAILLYVTILGAGLALGFMRMTAGDMAIHILKVILVWVFVTDSEFGLAMAWNFYMGALKQGILYVSMLPDAATSSSLCPATSAGGTFLSFEENLINLFSPIAEAESAAEGNTDYLGAVLALLFLPAIGWVAALLLILAGVTLITAFIRALMAYLMAIMTIAVLLALSPIFISMALFYHVQAFKHYVDTWLTVLASHVMQPILLFAVLGLVMFVLIGNPGTPGEEGPLSYMIDIVSNGGDDDDRYVRFDFQHSLDIDLSLTEGVETDFHISFYTVVYEGVNISTCEDVSDDECNRLWHEFNNEFILQMVAMIVLCLTLIAFIDSATDIIGRLINKYDIRLGGYSPGEARAMGGEVVSGPTKIVPVGYRATAERFTSAPSFLPQGMQNRLNMAKMSKGPLNNRAIRGVRRILNI